MIEIKEPFGNSQSYSERFKGLVLILILNKKPFHRIVVIDIINHIFREF